MVRKLDKLDKHRKKKLDKKDAQILAVKSVKPKATVREIAGQTSIPKSTVHYRLQGIPETEEYQEAAKECLGLLMDAVRVYKRRIKGKPDPTGIDLRAANQLLSGMGLFRTKHDMELKGNVKHGVDIYALAEQLFEGVDPERLRDFLGTLRGVSGNDGNPAAGLGETVSPDDKR